VRKKTERKKKGTSTCGRRQKNMKKNMRDIGVVTIFEVCFCLREKKEGEKGKKGVVA